MKYELGTKIATREAYGNALAEFGADYDIVVGPVANDNTMPVLNLFFKGAYSEEETLRRLLPQRLKDQYAFKTDNALSCLRYREVVKA